MILRELARRLRAKTYVEIGVDKGEAFLGVACPLKIAVDPYNNMKPKFIVKDRSLALAVLWGWSAARMLVRGEVVRFFEMPSDMFFSEDAASHLCANPIDLAFIDGLHTHDQALRDVLNCACYLAPGGVIVMHDCNPVTPSMAIPATSWADAHAKSPLDWNGDWCGDVWKAVVDLRAWHPELEVCVLDCDFGVGLVRHSTRSGPQHLLAQDPLTLGYDDLQAQRVELLNLKPASYFTAFLDSLGPSHVGT